MQENFTESKKNPETAVSLRLRRETVACLVKIQYLADLASGHCITVVMIERSDISFQKDLIE